MHSQALILTKVHANAFFSVFTKHRKKADLRTLTHYIYYSGGEKECQHLTS